MLTSELSKPARRVGPVADRVERLVDDLIELNAENAATRQRLIERGWSAAFLDEHEGDARARANARFVRQLDDEPVRSLQQVEDEMADVITSMLPSTLFIVAELQGRGFTKTQIDLKLHRAKARTALAFAHATAGAH